MAEDTQDKGSKQPDPQAIYTMLIRLKADVENLERRFTQQPESVSRQYVDRQIAAIREDFTRRLNTVVRRT